jgi:hypothetical protein
MRLNQERQNELEPKRLEYAKEQITKLGYAIDFENDTMIRFLFKGHPVSFFPYSGWHSGSTIKDGRGLQKLLKQIK